VVFKSKYSISLINISVLNIDLYITPELSVLIKNVSTMNEEQTSQLLQYEGVGQRVAESLLNRFGNIERVESATAEELESVDHVGPIVAQRIVNNEKKFENTEVGYKLPQEIHGTMSQLGNKKSVRDTNSDESLIDLYSAILDRYDLRQHTAQEQISILKHIFHGDINNQHIAEAVGCDQNYPSRFKWNEDAHRVLERESSSRARRYQASKKREVDVLTRDGCCVNCGYTPSGIQDCVVHHIHPVVDGGLPTMDNLAVLCTECHSQAHNGRGAGKVFYDSSADFWEWAKTEECTSRDDLSILRRVFNEL